MDLQTLFNLNDRVAVVTGGSRGIGKMIVEGYLNAGCARIYISARKSPTRLKLPSPEYGDKVIGLPCDLSTVEGCDSLAAQIAEREEKVDILVNNAGAAWGADFGTVTDAQWDRVMDLNVKGLFFLTQALHPLMKKAATFERPGKVINIASIDGIKINPWQTYAYQASKAAVIHLTRRLAAELVKDNILVSGIAPGAFQSEMNKAAARSCRCGCQEYSVSRESEHLKIWPVSRSFLAARSGDYIVGDTLACDGGIAYSSLPGNGIAPLKTCMT